jgi:NitT/TauT family transport system substrate-binding protein
LQLVHNVSIIHQSFKSWMAQAKRSWKVQATEGITMRNRIGVRVVGLLTALTLISTCFGQIAEANDKVTFVTDFGYLGRHAYYFVALEKGYYKSEGLDVTIVRGQGSADAVKQVGAGTAQIGFADMALVILGRSNDRIPVKVVSVIYARPPHAVFCLKEANITKPKDLEDKRIAGTASSSVRKLFSAYAKKTDFDGSGIKWLVGNSDSMIGMLALGRTDCVEQYTVGEALFTKAVAPKQISVLSFADAGLEFYSNSIIASDNLVSTNPNIIRKFVKATLRGLADALANPKEAGQIIARAQPQIEPETAEAETIAVGKLVQGPRERLGSVDPERVQNTIDLVANAYSLGSKVTVDELYAPGFVTP